MAITKTEIVGFPCRRGKVRDVYDLGDKLVIVTTDRISAFDWVLADGVPDKGKILTQLTLFWMNLLKVENHLISTDLNEMGPAFASQKSILEGRTILVKKTDVVPIECVVRGWLAGSGWKEYQLSSTVCGIKLPAGLKQSSKLPGPIFTPATKAETGHDENISFEQMVKEVGAETANVLRDRSIDIYSRAAAYSHEKGIILADTKFEWGKLKSGEIILIDEALTPDSSRFWDEKSYATGISPPSFDKQYIRDWLETTSWDKNSPPPAMPQATIVQTRLRYLEAFKILTGKDFV
ncbi:MAG: phosphoribosylaminoimidazolesuccinocarboxamide synthase [Planctomycetota bacterium]|nr:MAG: phosphoribosylaminoimidazolesuccinocarboxamide synthase [Planctomycetota bacterium]